MQGFSQKRALLIAGPTASGKSGVALREAQQRNGVIINADALQVYAELRILTARPTGQEELMVPHRLYGHVSGREAYSVGRWLGDVKQAIAAVWEAERLPIIVGGTGLYFRALEQGLADVPEIDAAIRAFWRDFAGDLHAELQRRDPEAAGKLAPNDRQRIIRALEVFDSTGRPLAHWQKAARSDAILDGAAVERRLLLPAASDLYARAEARLDAMIAQGAVHEVESVIGYDPSLPMMRAIGAPELSAYVKGEVSLTDAVTRAKTATRNYIKRQFTWWRGQGQSWIGVKS